MTLKELITELKKFDCEALRDKEVAHTFATSLGYSYKEIVTGVFFDAKNNMFHIKTGREEQYRFSNDAIVKANSTVHPK